MLFWLAAALMTLAAALAVMLPFLHARGKPAPGTDHDIEVYRDQLDELGREEKRGLIAPAEAEEARAEIGRRILRIGSGPSGPTDGARAGGMRGVAAAAVLAVPLVSWGVYGLLGSPGVPAQPLQERLSRDPDDSSIEELVARAETHLSANPDDGRGWEVLAPVYYRLGRYSDSAAAYRNAIRVSGASAPREAGLGEALVGAEEGIVSADAEAAFERALELEPRDPRARFFLGMARAQEGDDEEAAGMWREIVSQTPADSPWRGAAREALRQQERAGEPRDPSGPGEEEMAAAADLSQEQRAAMIEDMVAGLDARLRENPDDPEGWRRLVRSYSVLGEQDEARAALDRGLAALGPESGEAVELAEFAAGLGIVADE